jgi:phage protein D
MIQERDIMEEPYVALYFNSRQVPEDMMKYIETIEVEEANKKSSIARITVEDTDQVWINDAGVKKGVPITIRGGHRKDHRVLFFGKISGVEAQMPVEGIRILTISAVDRGVQAFKARNTRTWRNVKISDVITQVLRECGYDPVVEDSKVKLSSVVQRNEMNGDFLKRWITKQRWYQFKTPSGQYYVGSKSKGKITMDTLSYLKGGMEIRTFNPYFNEITEEDE